MDEWEDGEIPSAPPPAPSLLSSEQLPAAPLVAAQPLPAAQPLLHTRSPSRSRSPAPAWSSRVLPERPLRGDAARGGFGAARDLSHADEPRGSLGQGRTAGRGGDDRPPPRPPVGGRWQEGRPSAPEGGGRWEAPPPHDRGRWPGDADRSRGAPAWGAGAARLAQRPFGRPGQPPAVASGPYQTPAQGGRPGWQQQQQPAPDARFVDRDDDSAEEGEEGEAAAALPQADAHWARHAEYQAAEGGRSQPSALALVAGDVASGGASAMARGGRFSAGGSGVRSGGPGGGSSLLGSGGAAGGMSLLGSPAVATSALGGGNSLLGSGGAASTPLPSAAGTGSLLGSGLAAPRVSQQLAAGAPGDPSFGGADMEAGELPQTEVVPSAPRAALGGGRSSGLLGLPPPSASRWGAPRPMSDLQQHPPPPNAEAARDDDGAADAASPGGWHEIEGPPQQVPPPRAPTPPAPPAPRPALLHGVSRFSAAGPRPAPSALLPLLPRGEEHVEPLQQHAGLQASYRASDRGRSKSPRGGGGLPPPSRWHGEGGGGDDGRMADDSFDGRAWRREAEDGHRRDEGYHHYAPHPHHDGRWEEQQLEGRHYRRDGPDPGGGYDHGQQSRHLDGGHGWGAQDRHDDDYSGGGHAWAQQQQQAQHEHHLYAQQQQQQHSHYHLHSEQYRSAPPGPGVREQQHWEDSRGGGAAAFHGSGSAAAAHEDHEGGRSRGGSFEAADRRWAGGGHQSHMPQSLSLHHEGEGAGHLRAAPPDAAPLDNEAHARAELDALKERALWAPLADVLAKPGELHIFELELSLVRQYAALRAARERLAESAVAAEVLVQAADRLLGVGGPPTSGGAT